MSTDLKDILVEALQGQGYTGVYAPDGSCACVLEDFMPCGENPMECVPGFKSKCEGNLEHCEMGGCSDGSECEFVVTSKRPVEGDE